jgi:predicted DNA-binding transcriptional regulator AlpA
MLFGFEIFVEDLLIMNMDFEEILSGWKTPLISRKALANILGMSPSTLRNLDTQGVGVPGKIRVGHRSVSYPIVNVPAWLESRHLKYSNEPVTITSNASAKEAANDRG